MAELSIDLDAGSRCTKVWLRGAMSVAETIAQRLAADGGGDGEAELRVGPDQWLLLSERRGAADRIAVCERALEGLRYHAVDMSAALLRASLAEPDSAWQSGTGALRDLLAMGAAIDWHARQVAPGYATRLRFASIPVVVHVRGAGACDLYYDRSYRQYLERWLARASSDARFER